MAKRKAPPRKSRSSQKASSGMVTWLGIFALSVGGIWAYENRAQLLPTAQKVSSVKPQGAKETYRPQQVPVPVSAPALARQQTAVSAKPQTVGKLTAPVPPKSIPQAAGASIAAVIAADRVPEPAATASVKAEALGRQQHIAQSKLQYSFCGSSGLKNCVEDGHIFWRDGRKQVISGITVARTDEAACVDERRRGFAAKLRLRDFLNSGDFYQSGTDNNLKISRQGVSFEEQLLREGLAKPVSQKNPTWCG